MSAAIYPSLPGLQWPVARTPLWKTSIKTTPSGREWRRRYMHLPRYRYALRYEFLRSEAAFAEFQGLFGFFNARGGAADSFLFLDPDDRSVTAQAFGVGNGTATQFQLVRTFGGFAEPVYDLVAAPQIYIGGVLQASGYTVSAAGLVTFSTAPAAAAVLTWSGSYYWRVRFEADELTFEQFIAWFWKTGEVKLITVPPE